MSYDAIPENLQHAPADLDPDIREFFEYIVTGSPAMTWDASARTLLIRYCEVLDELRKIKAERVSKQIGFVFKDKHGQPRIHPLAKHEIQLTNELGKLFRLLGWDQAATGQGDLFVK